MKTKHITVLAILSVFFIAAFNIYSTSNNKCDNYRMKQYIESRVNSIPSPALDKLAESMFCYK